MEKIKDEANEGNTLTETFKKTNGKKKEKDDD